MDKKTDTFLGTTRSRASRPLRRLARRIGFLQEETAPERPLRICDVGANPINTPDYEDLLDLGACEVWGFEPVGIKDWTGEQVKQLAMAAAGVFSSLDLAVACLDELVRRKIIAAEAPARFVDQLPAWMLKPEGRAGE